MLGRQCDREYKQGDKLPGGLNMCGTGFGSLSEKKQIFVSYFNISISFSDHLDYLKN